MDQLRKQRGPASPDPRWLSSGSPEKVRGDVPESAQTQGIAVLAAYMAWRKPRENLGEYLDKKVFEKMGVSEIKPDPEDVKGFETYMARFKAALHVERAAVEHLKERQA